MSIFYVNSIDFNTTDPVTRAINRCLGEITATLFLSFSNISVQNACS